MAELEFQEAVPEAAPAPSAGPSIATAGPSLARLAATGDVEGVVGFLAAADDDRRAGTVNAMQRTVGNRSVTRLLQRAAAPAAVELSPLDLEHMREDVDFIVSLLREQILTSSEEARIVATVRRHAEVDRRHNAAGRPGTANLDQFLLLLKTRTFTRRTARSGWVEQWVNAYDTCWHELEDENLAAFGELVSRSAKQGTAGPSEGPSENLWATLGKQEAMGVWGILKGMGLVLAGVVDAAVWAAWKQSGAPLGAVLEQFGVKDAAKTPALTPYLTKNYDEVAKLLGKALDVDPAKDETLLGQSSYEIGEFGGKIVGLLTLAGAGGGTAGQTVAGATKALGVAGALKSMEDASASIAKRVRVLNKRKPPPTFTEILLDEAILIEVANILANALGAASGAGDAAPALAKAFARFGWVVDAAQLAPVVAKAWKDYNDPALAKDPEARAAAMRDHLATIVGTIASTAGSKYDDAQAKRAEQAKTEADERFQERYNAREPANAAEPESPAPAMSREEELAKLIAEQEADLAQGDVGLTDVDPGAANVLDLPEYQEGIATASEIFQRLPDIENPKNVAAGVEGEPHLSGWAGEKMEATGRARAEGLEAGYEPEPHFRDPAGSPGQYESSHSERRRAAGTSDQHFGSSKPLCPACQRWFSARAGLEGRPQFVSDPTGVHVFMPDGSHSVPPHPR